MDVRRRIISITSGALLLAPVSAMRVAMHESAPDACTLLSAADASKALEVTSLPGKRIVESSPDGCGWSNDPAISDTSRRVMLVTHSPRAFQIAKRPAITTIKVEPISGIGDEAFYQIYPSGGPFIWAIKGNTAISIRIMTREPAPFTREQEKAKEIVLAKAAVAKL